MYQKVSTDMNFVARELDTLAFWKEHKIFEKSVASLTARRRPTASRISDMF